MTTTVGAETVRRNLSDILYRTSEYGERFVVRRGDNRVAAIVPIDDFESLSRRRRDKLTVLDAIHARMPEVPEEEVNRDIAAAIAEVRHRRGRGR